MELVLPHNEGRLEEGCQVSHHGSLGGSGGLAQLLLADALDEVASVDLDWALDLAHTISCACLLALVLVDARQLLQPACSQFFYYSPSEDLKNASLLLCTEGMSFKSSLSCEPFLGHKKPATCLGFHYTWRCTEVQRESQPVAKGLLHGSIVVARFTRSPRYYIESHVHLKNCEVHGRCGVVT